MLSSPRIARRKLAAVGRGPAGADRVGRAPGSPRVARAPPTTTWSRCSSSETVWTQQMLKVMFRRYLYQISLTTDCI